VAVVDGRKLCSRCHAWKPLDEFPKDPSHGASQGFRHCICKACRREKGRLVRAAVRTLPRSVTET
jgi:hypothetical protein